MENFDMKKIPVVAAMIQKDKKILIAKRIKPPVGWEFPGGKIEDGESKVDALIREIQEELAIRIQVGKHIGQSEVLTNDKKIIMDLFACIVLDGVPQNKEHEMLKWIDPSRLRLWDWAPADIPLLSQVEAYFGVKND